MDISSTELLENRLVKLKELLQSIHNRTESAKLHSIAEMANEGLQLVEAELGLIKALYGVDDSAVLNENNNAEQGYSNLY